MLFRGSSRKVPASWGSTSWITAVKPGRFASAMNRFSASQRRLLWIRRGPLVDGRARVLSVVAGPSHLQGEFSVVPLPVRGDHTGGAAILGSRRIVLVRASGPCCAAVISGEVSVGLF